MHCLYVDAFVFLILAPTNNIFHSFPFTLIIVDLGSIWKKKQTTPKCILKGKRNAYSLWIIFVSKIYFCVNESGFEMLNIHIWTHCDTFHCKQTMCASRVNGKSDRGNACEIQAVWNNRKNWCFKCHSFWQISINWKLLNVNINMGHENYAKCEF